MKETAKFVFITWVMLCSLWLLICITQDQYDKRDRLEDCLAVQGTTINAQVFKECLK
jgi:hypothetical protein